MEIQKLVIYNTNIISLVIIIAIKSIWKNTKIFINSNSRSICNTSFIYITKLT